MEVSERGMCRDGVYLSLFIQFDKTQVDHCVEVFQFTVQIRSILILSLKTPYC